MKLWNKYNLFIFAIVFFIVYFINKNQNTLILANIYLVGSTLMSKLYEIHEKMGDR